MSFLKVSLDSQIAFAAGTHRTEGQWPGGATEHGKVTHVLSKNTKGCCFEERGQTFIATKDI
jgi:hypothetical protein